MKRQRGRNRGGGNAPGGGGKPQQNVNRAFDSNGPDNVKIRGHAQHVFEKYQQLARDAFSSGDRVLAENYLQHADHYFRVLRTIQPNRSPSEILGRDVLASGLDIDFEEEGETFEDAQEGGDLSDGSGAESRFDGRSDVRTDGGRSDNGRYEGQRFEGRQENGRHDNGRPDARRDDRGDRFDARRDTQDNSRFEGRRDTSESRISNRRDYQEPRESRSEASLGDQPSREPRSDNRRDYQDTRDSRRDASEPRNDGRRDVQEPREVRTALRENQDARDSRPEGGREGRRSDNRREREARNDRRYSVGIEPERKDEPAAPEPLAVITPETAPLLSAAAETAQTNASPMLRSEDGGVSQAPAFLQAVTPAPLLAPAEEAEPVKPKPRRRRTKTAEAVIESEASIPPPVEEA